MSKGTQGSESSETSWISSLKKKTRWNSGSITVTTKHLSKPSFSFRSKKFHTEKFKLLGHAAPPNRLSFIPHNSIHCSDHLFPHLIVNKTSLINVSYLRSKQHLWGKLITGVLSIICSCRLCPSSPVSHVTKVTRKHGGWNRGQCHETIWMPRAKLITFFLSKP